MYEREQLTSAAGPLEISRFFSNLTALCYSCILLKWGGDTQRVAPIASVTCPIWNAISFALRGLPLRFQKEFRLA